MVAETVIGDAVVFAYAGSLMVNEVPLGSMEVTVVVLVK